MTTRTDVPLEDSLLVAAGVPHGFGQRRTPVPEGAHFPRQVHGVAVWSPDADSAAARAAPPEADAAVTASAGRTLGILTADCVPLLVSWRGGERVAAIHAGWRGLAAGVIEAGLDALLEGRPLAECWVAIGPAARACCYEVDEPVHTAIRAAYGESVDGAILPGGSSGHYQLDMVGAAEKVVRTYGIETSSIGREWGLCTICEPARFESYRREGASAGRLRHFITRPVTIGPSA